MTERIFSILQIAVGAAALSVALAPMIAKKGGHAHRRYGSWFVSLAMFFSLVTWIRIRFLGADLLEFFTAMVAAYFAVSGRRVWIRRAQRGLPIRRDWALAAITLGGGFGLCGWGAGLAMIKHDRTGGLVLSLGFLAVGGALFDLKSFLFPSRATLRWRLSHLARMLAAFTLIATALCWRFSAQFLPPLVLGAAGLGVAVFFEIRRATVAEARVAASLIARVKTPFPQDNQARQAE